MSGIYDRLSTPSLKYDFEKLSTEQKYAFARFSEGQNLFITGPGGTGKTRLIQFLVEYMNSIGKSHQVCALTGCAATLLNCKAKTIHSWSGVKLARGNSEDIIRRVIRNRNFIKSWRGVEVLVVDEVSMMSSKMFDLLDNIGRVTRRNTSKPFGGLQLIFTGDFFQLPPIPDQNDPSSGEFCFQHPRWAMTFKLANCIELKTFFRQTDPAYISILQEVRRGTISPANIELLETRVNKKGEPASAGIVPTKLFPIRSKVDNINSTSYAKLEGEEKLYHFNVTTKAKVHLDTGVAFTPEESDSCDGLSSDQISQEVDNLITSLFTEKTVRLKIGTLVMCTVNLEVERGICNGSQGVVIGFAESNAVFESNKGGAIILPDELMYKTNLLVPVVRFANGVTMKVAPHQRQSEEFPCVIVSQIPLCFAWALTIHKIQGATLDMAEMDIGRSIFAAGQSYVALSRVKTLEGLYLSEFNPTKIKANPLVIEFYDSFPKISESEKTEEYMRVNPPTTNVFSLRNSCVASPENLPIPTLVPRSGIDPFSQFAYIGEDSGKKYGATTTTEKKDPTIKTIKF